MNPLSVCVSGRFGQKGCIPTFSVATAMDFSKLLESFAELIEDSAEGDYSCRHRLDQLGNR